MRAASCTLAVPMLAREFSADRSALVARRLLKIAHKMACRTTCQIFSPLRGQKGWRLPAQMVSSRGRRAGKGSWHVEKVRLVALGAAAFLRWPSSQGLAS